MTQTASQSEVDGRIALNENQRRRIVSTFSYVDDLLRNVERLSSARSSRSADFVREVPDLSEAEARMLLALADRVRTRMLSALDHFGIPRPPMDQSSRWNVLTSLQFADIALSELTPSTLRGYGTIRDDSATEVVAIASDLRELILHGRELLNDGQNGTLRQQLALIQSPYGEVLRAAEDLSARLGLIEARHLIAAAADRADTSVIQIGIFGRTSSGKSSLINALLGVFLLPVGATPVTAVPIRITQGPISLSVFFNDGRREDIDVARLPAYATETGNPGNRLGVRSILVHTPHVPEGIAFLDTPGVGSLSQSGPAQAFAWLPRCDLGIVLVAAGTPMGRDELALVGGLTQAGITVEVLISKSDLLSESDQAATIDYVQRELASVASGSNIRVRAFSVMPSHRELLDRWRNEELAMLVADRQRIAAASQSRRVRAIAGALSESLARRSSLDEAGVDLQRVRSEAERAIVAAADDLESGAPQAIVDAAGAVANAWQSGDDPLAAARLVLLGPASDALGRARAAADRILDSDASGSAGKAESRIPPIFDLPLLDDIPVPAAPGLADRLFGAKNAERHLEKVRSRLKEGYGRYAERVRVWALERLNENFQRVTATRTAGAQVTDPALEDLSRLIEKHFPMTP